VTLKAIVVAAVTLDFDRIRDRLRLDNGTIIGLDLEGDLAVTALDAMGLPCREVVGPISISPSSVTTPFPDRIGTESKPSCSTGGVGLSSSSIDC